MSEATAGSSRPFDPDGRLALRELMRELVRCQACPRLVEWRTLAARHKRRAYRHETYWARPVPSFGDPQAWLVIIGLAPGAHGSNRTGRMFTGDHSGEWLYRSLHRAGLASQPVASRPGDGLRLQGVYVTAAVRCAPPGNRPQREEWLRCRRFLAGELTLLRQAQVLVCLGAFAWQRTLETVAELGWALASRPRFAHLAATTAGQQHLLAAYHPSQQNTFTGRLTEPMLDQVWERSLALQSAGGRETSLVEGSRAPVKDNSP